MTAFLSKVRQTWPAWLIIAFIAAIPYRRSMELPLAIFALYFLAIFVNTDFRAKVRDLKPLIVPLFVFYWVPVFLSAFDSYYPAKTWAHAATDFRLLTAALTIAVLMQSASLRWLALRGITWVLLFWALDGYVQFIVGYDLFGFPNNQNRLGALFGEDAGGYGPLLAMLSPMALEYARERWKPLAWAAALLLIAGAVFLAGMRTGWLVMGLITSYYLVVLLRSPEQAWKRVGLWIPVAMVLLAIVTYSASPIMKQRLDDSLLVSDGSVASLDTASSLRLPIWRTAIAMYQGNPVNGVGAAAFPVAYYYYAQEDDPWVNRNPDGNGGSYAHNVVLEVMSETGSIGLLGLILAYALCWRYWGKASLASRSNIRPFAMVLLMVMFPLNSHFSLYASTLSSLTWVMVGLCAAAWRPLDSMEPADG